MMFVGHFYGETMKKILYFDLDGVLVDFQSAFSKVEPELLVKYKGNEDEIPGIFALMEPLPGSLEAYASLSEYFETYILSASPWENPTAWSDKLNWVKKYLPTLARKRLVLSHNKQLCLGDFLIDDRPNNGANYFKGKHILFGQGEFRDWSAVIEYLMRFR